MRRGAICCSALRGSREGEEVRCDDLWRVEGWGQVTYLIYPSTLLIP